MKCNTNYKPMKCKILIVNAKKNENSIFDDDDDDDDVSCLKSPPPTRQGSRWDIFPPVPRYVNCCQRRWDTKIFCGQLSQCKILDAFFRYCDILLISRTNDVDKCVFWVNARMNSALVG